MSLSLSLFLSQVIKLLFAIDKGQREENVRQEKYLQNKRQNYLPFNFRPIVSFDSTSYALYSSRQFTKQDQRGILHLMHFMFARNPRSARFDRRN